MVKTISGAGLACFLVNLQEPCVLSALTWKKLQNEGYDSSCPTRNLFVTRAGNAANDLHLTLHALNTSQCLKKT